MVRSESLDNSAAFAKEDTVTISTDRLHLPRQPARVTRQFKAAAVATLLAALLATGLLASKASGAVVQGSSGGTWIWVTTGAKNYSNHTQWVSKITVLTGRYGACPGKLEGWTYKWYATKTVCGEYAISWFINRWIPTGNAVCGASQNRYGGRDVACIAIRV